jgi:hypothetical protein
MIMRRIALAGGITAVLLGLGAVATTSAASQAAEPTAGGSKTLHFDVEFSPFTVVAANNVRDPNSPFSLGDEIIFHDQLSAKGQRVGDEVGSCVIAALTPEVIANCSLVIRLPGGTITGQFASSQGPAPKAIALTGGTGTYLNVGGEGTLVEFGNGHGSLTLNVLAFAPRGRGA